MKKFVLSVFVLLTAFLSVKTTFASAQSYAPNSTAEIVMEVDSNRVIHEKNAHEKKYMASTTKILTAITVIENCDLNSKVAVGNETVGIEGSSIYLRAGEVLTVKELLYGLMLRSGNDCAETLAVFCSGSIKDFALLMNKTAEKIGSKNSNFVNPHGLHDDNHYTTAYDLALISCYAMKNDNFREIVGTKSVKISNSLGENQRLLINKNKMLKNLEGETGIKTGYTKKAGRCLVSSCMRDGVEYVSVVLNCGPMFERSTELLNSAFKNYSVKRIVDSENILAFIPINGSDEECAVGIKKDILLPLTEIESDNLDIVINVPKCVDRPIKKEEIIGSLDIYYQNNLLFSEKIYTIIDIK